MRAASSGRSHEEGNFSFWQLNFKTKEDDIFSKITNNEDLENLSKELWKLNQYDKNEKDRVLLYVNLSANGLNDKMIYNKTLYIDESRNIIQSAMSQCVSLTLALTVECLFNTKEISGIKRIFHDKKNVSYILENLKKLGVTVKEIWIFAF